MMSVGRFDSRAISIALFTANVVVPTPPLAPKNAIVRLVRRSVPFAARMRSPVRANAVRKASSSEAVPSSFDGQARNSFAPARIAWRICSGSFVAATAKMAADGHVARRRSSVRSAAVDPFRMSAIAMSGATPDAMCRSSVTAIERLLERSSPVMCVRKCGSVVLTTAESLAMALSEVVALRARTDAGQISAQGLVSRGLTLRALLRPLLVCLAALCFLRALLRGTDLVELRCTRGKLGVEGRALLGELLFSLPALFALSA